MNEGMAELKDLIVRSQAGDLGAFNAVVRRFQDMAVGYAYSQLRDFHLAEDVAQDAFVGAYLGLSRLQDPEAFPGWFRRVVHTHCHRLTRRKRLPTVELGNASAVAAKWIPRSW